jgi:hypothetical protein
VWNRENHKGRYDAQLYDRKKDPDELVDVPGSNPAVHFFGLGYHARRLRRNRTVIASFSRSPVRRLVALRSIGNSNTGVKYDNGRANAINYPGSFILGSDAAFCRS